jgi:hypothetical protein
MNDGSRFSLQPGDGRLAAEAACSPAKTANRNVCRSRRRTVLLRRQSHAAGGRVYRIRNSSGQEYGLAGPAGERSYLPFHSSGAAGASGPSNRISRLRRYEQQLFQMEQSQDRNKQSNLTRCIENLHLGVSVHSDTFPAIGNVGYAEYAKLCNSSWRHRPSGVFCAPILRPKE